MADAPAEPTPSTPASTPAEPAAPVAATPAPVAPATPAVAAPVEPAKPVEPAAPVAAPVAPVVPEKYDFAALKLPEGVALDAPLLAAVEPVFKELGLTQENASKLVEAHAKALQAIETKKEADFVKWQADQVKQHQSTLRSEFGLQYDANMATAQRGIARFCSPEMKALLDQTGLGNHPEFVKAFLQVGKMVTEDTPPTGGRPTASGKSAAEVLYGNTQNH
jgi:hypothetical protein